MSMLGSVPVQTLRFNNTTVAASLGGTAAATILGTITTTYARAWEVHNLTTRNLELIIGTEISTVSGICIPGTVSNTGMSFRSPVTLQGPLVIRARTTENTPVTIASTTPFYINLWA